MKKIKLFIFLAALGLLVVSCKRDITEPVISSNPTQPTTADLSFTGSFTMSNSDSLMTFSWSAAAFGFQSSTTYALQLSATSDFSKNVATLFTTQSLTGTAKVGDINTLLLSWGYPIGTAVTVYYRTTASVSTNVATVYSNVKSKSLTPYDAVINYPMVYVPGSYQNWTPGAVNGTLYSYGFNSQYQSIIRLNDGTNATTQFKIAPAANWNSSWGGNLTQTGNNYAGTLDPNGGNFVVIAACYTITVDVNALTISLTQTNDWGLIGDAVPTTGWNSSVPMYYNGQRKMWEITADLLVGSIKFRADNAWTLNYGSNANDGTLQSGGSNITISAAGNYLIRFDPVKLTYTIHQN
jgi:hypothetical protein